MTWKFGDTVGLELKIASVYGPPFSPIYATLAAFLADGWSVAFWQNGAVLAVQPTFNSFAADPALDGTHYLSVVLPYGVSVVRVVRPPLRPDLFSVYDLEIVVPVADTDSIQANINATTGAIVSGSSTTTATDLSVIEGDSFNAQFTIPTSALKIFDLTNKLIFQYSDLSDISAVAWTIAAQARYTTEGGQLPSIPVAFSLQAAVIDKVNRVVGIGWQSSPTGAVVDDILPTAPTVTVAAGLITGTTGGTGGHFYGTKVPTVALAGGGGSGGVLTATVVNGQVTGYVVTNAGSAYASAPTATLSVLSDGSVLSRTFRYDIQLQPPAGSTYAGSKLSVINGNVIILRQQTTSP